MSNVREVNPCKVGHVRGILCMHCNTALGHMKDRPDLLRRAATYLEEADAGVGERRDTPTPSPACMGLPELLTPKRAGDV
jgi:Recombination endonuclease VII